MGSSAWGTAIATRGKHLDAAAAQELEEKTALNPDTVHLEQLGAFGRANRDPRMRVITVAYFALIRPDLVPLVKAGSDAVGADWIAARGLTPRDLAFDHYDIIQHDGRSGSPNAST